MTVTIGPYTFPVSHYDPDGDVLYLHTRAPDGAVDWEETPEGHSLRYGPRGELVGITLLSPRWLLEHHGKIEITFPQRQIDVAAEINEVLAPA